MNQLEEALAIGIIGGADGPTSIYISKQSLWLIIIEIIIFLFIFAFAIYGFVKNIKKRKIIKSIIYGIILLLVILPVTIFGVKRYKIIKEYQKFYDNLFSSENTAGLGIYTEAEDFEYFRKSNKLINVNIGSAGMGFLISKKLGENEFKVVKEIYGSGVPVVAEETEIALLNNNILKISEDEYFILENHVLKYFNNKKEYLIYSIEDVWISQ